MMIATPVSVVDHAAAQQAALDAGGSRALSGVTAGAPRLVALAGVPGDYVRGAIAVAQGRFQLDLVDRNGRHLRRLATDVVGTQTFQLMVPENHVQLRVTALDASAEPAAAATVSVSLRLAPDAQHAPPAALPSPMLAQLAREIGQGGGTGPFWADVARRGTPLVEPAGPGQVVVTFLARGARANVRLFGAPSGDHEWLERLGDTDVWFKSFRVPDDTRLSYKLAPDVPDLPGSARERRMAILATAQADPLNRAPWPADAPDVFNQESTLELPRAPTQPGLLPGGAPKGRLSDFPLASAALGNTRTVTLYLPPNFDPANPANVLLVLFDANAYLSKVPTPTILDNLIADGRLPPVIAVFVSEIDPATRARELPGNPAFADFVAGELLAKVEALTGATIPPSRAIVAGSSFGGLAAATIALRHPERFGNAVALSGSFWWHPDDAPADAPEYVADLVAHGPQQKVRFHLSAGLFEGAHADTAGILDTSRHLRDVLKAKGYDVSYREYAGGHDYLVWRGALADALLALAPRLSDPGTSTAAQP